MSRPIKEGPLPFMPDWVTELHYSNKWHELKKGTYQETRIGEEDYVVYRDLYREDETTLIPASIVVGWRYLIPTGEVINMPGTEVSTRSHSL